MINLLSVEYMVGTLVFFIAYLVVITPAGYVRAWVADKLGDYTPYDAGFLTLNPLPHISPVGLIFLCISYFGWPRYILINPYNIHGYYRPVRWLTAYFSDTVMYLFMGLVGLVLLIVQCGTSILYAASMMIYYADCKTHLFLARMYPHFSSFTIDIAFILIAITYLSIALAVVNFIMNLCQLCLIYLVEDSPEKVEEYWYLQWLLPVVLFSLFGCPLRSLILRLMIKAGLAIAHVLHIA